MTKTAARRRNLRSVRLFVVPFLCLRCARVCVRFLVFELVSILSLFVLGLSSVFLRSCFCVFAYDLCSCLCVVMVLCLCLRFCVCAMEFAFFVD